MIEKNNKKLEGDIMLITNLMVKNKFIFLIFTIVLISLFSLLYFFEANDRKISYTSQSIIKINIDSENNIDRVFEKVELSVSPILDVKKYSLEFENETFTDVSLYKESYSKCGICKTIFDEYRDFNELSYKNYVNSIENLISKKYVLDALNNYLIDNKINNTIEYYNPQVNVNKVDTNYMIEIGLFNVDEKIKSYEENFEKILNQILIDHTEKYIMTIENERINFVNKTIKFINKINFEIEENLNLKLNKILKRLALNSKIDTIEKQNNIENIKNILNNPTSILGVQYNNLILDNIKNSFLEIEAFFNKLDYKKFFYINSETIIISSSKPKYYNLIKYIAIYIVLLILLVIFLIFKDVYLRRSKV